MFKHVKAILYLSAHYLHGNIWERSYIKTISAEQYKEANPASYTYQTQECLCMELADSYEELVGERKADLVQVLKEPQQLRTIDDAFSPVQSALFERYGLIKTRKLSGELIDNFVAPLRVQTRFCK
ncbi:unnamed protein product [Lepeophtheirus salmonis]|uniref:(salmon louse) hypothetical protein n=1 Tax=Lepeophtheirus salmonis TaxID=72036 RepID=A0A7R8HC23_LEPSM|nr:unnamed protein product [Lepeophtheirus salmonis]CAF2999761.1 unnamed protein product [Lepeophtheirus salmonis]